MKFFDHSLPKYPLPSVSDYRLKAKKRIPKQLFDFLEGGAFDEVTLNKNRQDFHRIQLKKRVLKDVSDISMSTEIFGQKLDFPLILGPVGFAGAYSCRGEVQAAKAAAKANIPFSLSTVGICSIEEVALHSPVPFWFQCSLFKDRSYLLDLLQRAEAVKCPVLLLTVDLPIAGARYRYIRNKSRSCFASALDQMTHLSWWIDVRLRGKPLTLGNMPKDAPVLNGLSEMRKWMGNQLSLNFSWKDFEWIRAHWKGKVVIKGILDPEDAKMAQQLGADGIVVSNHGARHIDGILSTISALPYIREIVKDNRMKILFDGGITSGLDMVKAMALGADVCMIGKPWIYGLAVRGEQGVSDIIAILKNELKIAMTHLGITSLDAINKDLINRFD